jgi:uncharacterized membrane protein
MNRLKMAEAVAAIVTIIALTLAVWVSVMGPTSPIPMQYGLDGSVNRFGSRFELAGALAFMAVLNFIMMRLMKKQAASMTDPVRIDGLMRGRLMSSLIIGGLSLYITWSSLGSGAIKGAHDLTLAMIVMSLIFLGIGAVLGRVGPNPWMGVRTPWAFKSRLAWDRSNRLAGRLLFWLGAAGLIGAALAPQPLGFSILIIGVLIAAGWSAWESWRVWKSDPEAQAF